MNSHLPICLVLYVSAFIPSRAYTAQILTAVSSRFTSISISQPLSYKTRSATTSLAPPPPQFKANGMSRGAQPRKLLRKMFNYRRRRVVFGHIFSSVRKGKSPVFLRGRGRGGDREGGERVKCTERPRVSIFLRINKNLSLLRKEVGERRRAKIFIDDVIYKNGARTSRHILIEYQIQTFQPSNYGSQAYYTPKL